MQDSPNQSNRSLTTNEEMVNRISQLNDIIVNAMTRSQATQTSLGRRDIDSECDYPATNEITPQDLQDMYDRLGVATRVVDVEPMESWKICPEIYETEDEDNETAFEKSLRVLGKSLLGRPSWIRAESESHPLWDMFKRIDILSGIGAYGVVIMGINDGKSLDQPIDGFPKDGSSTTTPFYELKPLTKKHKLLYMRCLSQNCVRIDKVENEKTNERYGKPISYTLDLTKSRSNTDDAVGILSTLDAKTVHWSRVIHVADNIANDESHGVPRQIPVFNNLLDVKKLYGGSAEMYWQGAFPGISIQNLPGYTGKIDPEDTRQQLFDYVNSLQRFLALSGLDVKQLAPQVVDPRPQIDVQIEGICITLGVPKRKFTGSERGELASSQDGEDWDERVRQRRNDHCTPRIISAIIDYLILIGVLDPPGEEGYRVEWDEDKEPKPMEKVDIISKKTKALVDASGGAGLQSVMTLEDYYVKVFDLSKEEAQKIVENLEKKIADDIAKGIIPDPVDEVDMDLQKKEAELKNMQQPPAQIPPAQKTMRSPS